MDDNYQWFDGKLKWIDGSLRLWDCPHVSKCPVLVDTPEGMFEWNTDYPEPELPYRYVYMRELLAFLEGIPSYTSERGPFESCQCLKDIHD